MSIKSPADDVTEQKRLAALRQTGLLDTPAEESFDRITRLVSSILRMPIALVSLVDADRQWFKSHLGLEVRETPREFAFCHHAIESPAVMVVPDALLDHRFADNPLVKGPPGIRFYAGAPLATRSGDLLGTLCVIDTRPRELDPLERRLLADAAAIVSDTIELRRLTTQAAIDLRALQSQQEQIEEQKRELERQARILAGYARESDNARLRAERALEEKSLFIAAMAHELRTPLNAIIGFSEIIARQQIGVATPERYAEYGELINKSGAYLLELINDLLDLSKLEAGKFQVDPVPMDINASLSSLARSLSGLAKEKRIRFEYQGVAEPVVVHADQRAVKQVMMNLLSNAIKFTPQDGVVTLRLQKHDDEVEVTVEDTGCGIPEADISRIVKPYEQRPKAPDGDNETGHEHKGTGLGLAIVTELLRLHGSRLSISSRQGAGTTVRFRLPMTATPP